MNLPLVHWVLFESFPEKLFWHEQMGSKSSAREQFLHVKVKEGKTRRATSCKITPCKSLRVDFLKICPNAPKCNPMKLSGTTFVDSGPEEAMREAWVFSHVKFTRQIPSFLPYIGAKPKIVMLRDMAPDIEDSFCQLIELSQKGLYDRGRISKHN